MNETKAMVAEFHRKFDLAIADTPTLGYDALRKLRVRLILEEALEFAEACGIAVRVKGDGIDHSPRPVVQIERLVLEWTGNPDIIKMADGLADLDYVVQGANLAFGLPSEAIVTEVHRSNMSKVWPDGTVHKDAGGKVIKPSTYSPADIASILEKA